MIFIHLSISCISKCIRDGFDQLLLNNSALNFLTFTNFAFALSYWERDGEN